MEIYDRGWRLKALRKKRGLSQKAVADRLGVDRAAISAYERNIATPRIDVLENLALLYRTSVDYILGMAWSTVPPSTLMISRKVSRKRYAASSKPCGGNS